MLIVFVAMIFVAIITTITTAIVNAEAVRVASLKVTFFFVLADPVAIRRFDGPAWLMKYVGVTILALAHRQSLAVHPFLVPTTAPATALVNHLRTFVLPFVAMALCLGNYIIIIIIYHRL
jgi:hypothetical protein